MNLEIAVAVLLVIGVLFTLLGSVGLVLLPDFYSRLHGPSKASTLGLIALLLASALYFGGGQGSWHEVVIVLFLFVAAPISSAVLAQAALRRQVASVADLSRLESATDEPQNTG